MQMKDIPEKMKEVFSKNEFKPKKVIENIDLDTGKTSYTKEELLEKINQLPDDSIIEISADYDQYDERSDLTFIARTERLETQEEVDQRINDKMKRLSRKNKYR